MRNVLSLEQWILYCLFVSNTIETVKKFFRVIDAYDIYIIMQTILIIYSGITLGFQVMIIYTVSIVVILKFPAMAGFVMNICQYCESIDISDVRM